MASTQKEKYLPISRQVGKKKTKEGTHSCEMFWGPKTVPELQPASWNLGENEQVHCKRRTPSLMINSQHFQSISIAYLGCPDLPLFSQNVAVFSLSIGYDFQILAFQKQKYTLSLPSQLKFLLFTGRLALSFSTETICTSASGFKRLWHRKAVLHLTVSSLIELPFPSPSCFSHCAVLLWEPGRGLPTGCLNLSRDPCTRYLKPPACHSC